MFKVRLMFAMAALFTTALTTVVTVAPQPAAAKQIACNGAPEPVRA